jgi:hypothetical protein
VFKAFLDEIQSTSWPPGRRPVSFR